MKDKPVLVLRKREEEPGPDFDWRLAEALGLPKGLPYSTYMGAAWLVAASTGVDYNEFRLMNHPTDTFYTEDGDDYLFHGYWSCRLGDDYLDEDKTEVRARTAPHAICLAALRTRYWLEQGKSIGIDGKRL